MAREMMQNADGSFFISNWDIIVPHGIRQSHRDEEMGWNTDGLLGTLENTDKGYVTIVPIIKPLPAPETDATYDLTPNNLASARELGSLVNCYAIQGQIMRDERGVPVNRSQWTHITLLHAHDDGEGQEVLEPVITLLDSSHPANPYYEKPFS